MKFVVAALLILSSFTHAFAQETLGFSPTETVGSSIKLDGMVLQQVSGGYLALSVPPKYIMRFMEMAKFMEPRTAILAVIEYLENESRKLPPVSGPTAVPIGICFLNTNEVFEHRHKILDRYVQPVGTYTYLDRYGKAKTVQAYSGGPSRP